MCEQPGVEDLDVKRRSCLEAARALEEARSGSAEDDFDKLASALDAAERAGVSKADIEVEARRQQQHREEATAARQLRREELTAALTSAAAGDDEEALSSALSDAGADLAGLKQDVPQLLASARQKLADLQAARCAKARREAAESTLCAAMEGEDVPVLAQAINEAMASGLGVQAAPANKRKAALEEVKKRAQSRQVMAQRLEATRARGNAKALAQAIEAAIRIGVDGPAIARAQ
ncbi:unnamed protein product, partial [Polarella glacialis]